MKIKNSFVLILLGLLIASTVSLSLRHQRVERLAQSLDANTTTQSDDSSQTPAASDQDENPPITQQNDNDNNSSEVSNPNNTSQPANSSNSSNNTNNTAQNKTSNGTITPTGNPYFDEMLDYVLTAPGYPGGSNVIFNNKTYVFDFFHPPNTSNYSAGIDGYLIYMSRKDFPGLITNIISMSLGFIGPCGIHTPHIHPRANELAFAVQGAFYTGDLADNGSPLIINYLLPGQATLLPRGNIHWVANLGCEPAIYLSAYNDEDPGYTDIASNFFNLPVDLTSPTLGYLDPVNIAILAEHIPQNFTQGLIECIAMCGLI